MHVCVYVCALEGIPQAIMIGCEIMKSIKGHLQLVYTA